MKYLLALVGLTLLCGVWIKFQLWLKQIDPDKGDYQPGCGACKVSSCDKAGKTTNSETTETTISLPVAGSGESSGENECKEKRSPS